MALRKYLLLTKSIQQAMPGCEIRAAPLPLGIESLQVALDLG
jgi:hypothetical protein